MRRPATIIRVGIALSLVISVCVSCSQTGQQKATGDGPINRQLPADAAVVVAPDQATTPPSMAGKLALSSDKMVCDTTACSATEFSLKTLRELHVYSLWTGISGKHIELRKYYSPDGNLYYQKLVAFTTEAGSTEEFKPTEPLPHTRVVQSTETNGSGEAVAWDYLLVGGTSITTLQMAGKWRVDVYLDKLSGTPDMTREFTFVK